MKSPMAVKKFTAPVAIPSVSVGRMIEHGASLRLSKGRGSAMIILAFKLSSACCEVGKRHRHPPICATC